MFRLNSDNFFDFLRGFRIIFSTDSFDRIYQTIVKKSDFSRIFRNILDVFGVFVRFLTAYAMRRTAQIHDIYQKIGLDLLHLLASTAHRGEAWEESYL